MARLFVEQQGAPRKQRGARKPRGKSQDDSGGSAVAEGESDGGRPEAAAAAATAAPAAAAAAQPPPPLALGPTTPSASTAQTVQVMTPQGLR